MGTFAWRDIREKLDFTRAGRPALIGMAALLVLVAVAVGFVLSSAATTSNFTVTPGEQEQSEPDDAIAPTVFVHVSGAVCNPGVYELPLGARVDDAVRAAGGFAESADADSCNLARIVDDGEHIAIPARLDGEGDGDAPGDAGLNDGGASVTGLVNINTASEAQLESLPGIGPSTAGKIVAERTANGPFKSIDDLTRVAGIGEKKLAAIADLICV